MSTFDMKKWYFDFVTEKNEVFYGYFIIYKILGKKAGLVSAHLSLPNGSSLRDSLKVGYAPSFSDGSIKLGPHYLMKLNGKTRLYMELGRFTIDLHYLSLDEEWVPVKDAILLKKNSRFLKWHVPQPAARVEGRISSGHQELKIVGLGYQDIVETNIPPWRLPLAELLWGRAHCGNLSVVFNQITTQEGAILQNFHLSEGTVWKGIPLVGEKQAVNPGERDTDDQRFNFLSENEDRVTTITKESWTLMLKRRSIIEDAPVTTSERVRSPILKNALARVCGNPLEKKMLSKAHLSNDKIRLDGTAVHERVVWQWKTR